MPVARPHFRLSVGRNEPAAHLDPRCDRLGRNLDARSRRTPSGPFSRSRFNRGRNVALWPKPPNVYMPKLSVIDDPALVVELGSGSRASEAVPRAGRDALIEAAAGEAEWVMPQSSVERV